MSKTTFLLCRIALIIAGCFLVAWSSLNENYIVLPIWVAVGTSLLLFLRGGVKEVMKDERSNRIKEKTAGIAIQIFTIMAFVASALLVLLGKGAHPSLTLIGITVGYSVFGLLITYWIIYAFWIKFKARTISGGG